MKLQTGVTLIFIAAVLWAFDGVLRRALYGLPPIELITIEHLVGLIILAPFAWRVVRKEKFTRREWMGLIAVAALSGVAGTLFFTIALQKTQFISFSVVFLLQKLQPLFAIAAAGLLLGERITRRYALYTGIALVAAYFTTFPDGVVNFDTGAGTLLAALFAVGAAAAWGSSTALSKKLLSGHNERVVTFYRFFFTALLGALCIPLLTNAEMPARIPTMTEILYLVAIALSTGLVALVIYYRGLKTVPVRVSTIIELAFPLVAILIDMVLYKQFLQWSQIAASIVLLWAMYKVSAVEKVPEGADLPQV